MNQGKGLFNSFLQLAFVSLDWRGSLAHEYLSRQAAALHQPTDLPFIHFFSQFSHIFLFLFTSHSPGGLLFGGINIFRSSYFFRSPFASANDDLGYQFYFGRGNELINNRKDNGISRRCSGASAAMSTLNIRLI